MALTTPTTPHFPRFDPPIQSRSPSRSPRRRAQFAIKELDPLLGNLSPDSTLKALQATETIPGGATEADALTASIRDAHPAEREIGIRAAFAAQKLREWKNEVSQWSWPGKKERGFGLGFVSPAEKRQSGTIYCGSLPVVTFEQYETRLEDIRDDLDSLGIEEIKDHVLEAHLPANSPTASPTRPTNIRASSYGRMRDFTALITATVIQALPDLAKLNLLLETWDVRLRILRDLPSFLSKMTSIQSDMRTAFDEISDPGLATNLTEAPFDTKKAALGGQVSEIGRCVDKFLDILEGCDDALPQAWIDSLEKIELDYATWVVEAQRVVLRNDLAGKDKSESKSTEAAPAILAPSSAEVKNGVSQPNENSADAAETPMVPNNTGVTFAPAEDAETKHKRKPSLKLDLPQQQKGHRREISKVSVAESMYSNLSDLSAAEIMDARTTSVLPSPKVNVVDSPLRTSRDELTWFGTPAAAQQQLALKPPMLQRASTASIEVFAKDKLKRVMLRRTASWDMLSQMSSAPESTPSKALNQLTGADSPTAQVLTAKSDHADAVPMLPPPAQPTDYSTPLGTPSLQVEPLRVPSMERDLASTPPVLPRRSSRRNTIGGLEGLSAVTPVSTASTDGFQNGSLAKQPASRPATATMEPSARTPKAAESLEDKIQDILTSLPTKIRLAKDADSANSSTQASSNTSSRAPTPALTLSPAKADPMSRKGSSVDCGEIKVYHLTRTGQARDSPPVKLFVRTVGDGDRVMVRVGGGWADLGEYLREYSLHHGSRATGDGRLEVASFPGNNTHKGGSPGTETAAAGRKKSRTPSAAQPGGEMPAASELVNPKTRSSAQKGASNGILKDDGTWTPPPVPPIPSSYTARSPTITTSTNNRSAITSTTVADADAVAPLDLSQQINRDPETPAQRRYSTMSPGGITTTTVVTPPVTTTNYTPLGGAGPKPNNARRSATYGGATSSTANNNDAWVEGLVGKARAVSGGGSPTTTHGPTTTTTTTTTTTMTSGTPTSRRASSYFGLSPSSNINPSPVTISMSPSTSSVASDAKSRRASLSARPKSRMSLSDIGGIKRVFLRKKSDNAKQ